MDTVYKREMLCTMLFLVFSSHTQHFWHFFPQICTLILLPHDPHNIRCGSLLVPTLQVSHQHSPTV